jgi:hypothetical protein
MKSKWLTQIIGCALAALLSGAASAADPDPSKINLFNVNDKNTEKATRPKDFDKSGRIVGSWYTYKEVKGFLREADGTYRIFSQFPYPRAISDQGTIVGTYIFDSGYVSSHSWLYNSSTEETISLQYPGAFSTYALDMNERGLVAGYAQLDKTVNGEHLAVGFTWLDGSFTTISIPGADSTKIVSVNAKGQLAGRYYKTNPKTGSLGDPVQFLMEPSGSFKVVNPVFPRRGGGGDPWLIETLGNNGDYAGGCFDGDVVRDICYYVAATKTVEAIEFGEGSGCNDYLLGISSIKRGLVLGSCGDSGFIATRKAVLARGQGERLAD